MFKKYKNIITIILVVIIIGVVYTILTNNEDDKLLVSNIQNNVSSVIDSDLLNLLLNIKSVELNENIFSNPVFRSLEDFGQNLIPESVGRENPFAPVDLTQIRNQKQQEPQDIEL